MAATTVAVVREDIANLAKAANEDEETHSSWPAAAAEIDLESGIVLPAAGPTVMEQGKLQGQQMESYPLFPETGTKVVPPGSHLRVFS